MLRKLAKFFLWLAEGVHYKEFTDSQGNVYYGVANKKEF
jgi:hypothetical protein